MSFARYPEYKDSGVEWLGRVPAHWSVQRLKQLSRLVTEKSDKRDHPVGLENIESGSGKLIETETQFSGEGIAFRSGDILFGKLRPYLAKVFLADFEGEAVGDFHVLRPSPGTFPRFLQYQLLSPAFIALVDGSTYGAKMPRASWDFMRMLPLASPPYVEQCAIVAFLDRESSRIAALIAEQETLIERLTEKRRAIISHVVRKGLNPHAATRPSGFDWLGDVPAHWQVGALKRFWSVTDCKHVTAEFVSEGFPLASIGEVQDRYVCLDNAKRTTDHFYQELTSGGRTPHPGDLIFTRNATVGQVAQVREDCEPFAMGQDVCLLRRLRSEYSPDYLWHLMTSPVVKLQIETLMIGSTFKRLNVEEIRNLTVLMPPAGEQIRLASRIEKSVESINRLIAQAESAIRLLQERRKILIFAAVTGEIDVRGHTHRSANPSAAPRSRPSAALSGP